MENKKKGFTGAAEIERLGNAVRRKARGEHCDYAAPLLVAPKLPVIPSCTPLSTYFLADPHPAPSISADC